MKTDKCFMAFGKAKESTEGGVGIKRYIGVGAVNVIGLNPSKDELERIYGTTTDKDPSYISKKEDGTTMIRLDFMIKTSEEKHPDCNFIGKYSVFLEDRVFTNKEQTKVQVIDNYGETAWVTNEEFKTGTYEGNNTKFSTPYRPALVGEEKLIKFIKTYLEIPDSTTWSNTNKSFVKKTGQELVDSEASFSNIKNFFSGNLKEIKDLLSLFPQNKIKLVFGIKTTGDNKIYQDFYSTPLKYGSTNYNYISKEIENSRVSYPNTEFSTEELKEYNVNPTSFSPNPTIASAPSGLPAGWGVSVVDSPY